MPATGEGLAPQRVAYNQPVVPKSFSSRPCRLAALFSLTLALFFSIAVCASAQSSAEAATAAGGRILLVLPFDNRTGQPSLEWIREGAAEILSSRLASAGFDPMSRADRRYALDHLGLPQGFHPSRASSLKLAETLDVDSIIVGSYVTDGAGIIVEARVVDVPHLRMGDTVTARGDMRELIPVLDSLAWKITRQLDPGFSGSEETFVAASSRLGWPLLSSIFAASASRTRQERLRHLNRRCCSTPALARHGWRWAAKSTPASSMSKRRRHLPRLATATPAMLWKPASTAAFLCFSPAITARRRCFCLRSARVAAG